MGKLWYRPSRVQQATWSSPITSRVLLEAGFGTYEARYRQNGAPREDGTFNPRSIQVLEQAGTIPGLTLPAPASFHHNTIGTHTWRASVSYVTGAHNMKFGYFGGFLNPMQHTTGMPARTGSPVTGSATACRTSSPAGGQPVDAGREPIRQFNRNGVPTAFYAQDQWTTGRLTLQGGVRYDHYITTLSRAAAWEARRSSRSRSCFPHGRRRG